MSRVSTEMHTKNLQDFNKAAASYYVCVIERAWSAGHTSTRKAKL